MSVSSSLRAGALALALLTPVTGCAAIGSRTSLATRSSSPALLALDDRAHQGESFATDSQPLELGWDERGPVSGLSPAHGTGTRVGLIVLMVFIFPFVILVDLITLPFAAANGHPFHCTQVVVGHCCR